MTARPSDLTMRTPKPRAGMVLGRSAATGGYILKPASKAGSISIKQANTAVKSVQSRKK